MLSMKEIANDPALRASGSVVEVDGELRGKYLAVGSPIKFSDFTPKITAPRYWGSIPTKCLRKWVTAYAHPSCIVIGGLSPESSHARLSSAIASRCCAF